MSSEPSAPEPHDHESFAEAAIHAEYESGRREATEQRARAHVALRLVRMSAGFLVLLAGIAMMPLPGPGLPVVAIGLAVLARDVAWADRLLGHVRDRIPKNEDGGISRAALITMVFSGLAGVSGSAWWFFIR